MRGLPFRFASLLTLSRNGGLGQPLSSPMLLGSPPFGGSHPLIPIKKSPARAERRLGWMRGLPFRFASLLTLSRNGGLGQPLSSPMLLGSPPFGGSHPLIPQKKPGQSRAKAGVDEGIRTPDLLGHNQAL